MTAPDLSFRRTLGKQLVLRERSFDQHGIQLRSAPDGTGGEKLTFTGYASVYDTPYQVGDWLGPYTEVMARGCFTKTLADGADVPFKINHAGMTLARTKSGTLRLDPKNTHGLAVEADLDPRNTEVQNLRIQMDRGDVDEMSFQFGTLPGGSDWSDDGLTCVRTAVSLHKGDVSVVNYGANPATAGAKMRAREFIDHPEVMSEDEQRLLLRRLAAKFTPADPALRARLHQVSDLVREQRALSPEDASLMSQALGWLFAIDSIVDEGQEALAMALAVPNPDADDADVVASPQMSGSRGRPLFQVQTELLRMRRPAC